VEAKPIQVRASDAIEVSFDPNRCAHEGECLRRAPGVFNLQARPWIQPGNLPADEVAAAIEQCPSGALSYRRLDDGPDEAPETATILHVRRNGPVWVRGVVEMLDATGQPFDTASRFALCRCGQSGNKPFCDGSHRAAGFRAP
jgi:uncharacterized Fe-S cluster protein YjdI